MEVNTEVDSRQHSLIYGVFPDTLYKDADEQEGDLYAAGDWLEWPLTGSDGSVAALVTMVSDMKVGTFLAFESKDSFDHILAVYKSWCSMYRRS